MEAKIKGKVNKLVQTSAHTLDLHYDDGVIEVCQLSMWEMITLQSFMHEHGLLFRVNDGMMYENFYIHFIKPENGVDGVGWITGTRLKPTKHGGK